MKNRPMTVLLMIFLISTLLISTSCVNGGAISSKSYGFSKGVTGKAAEPVAWTDDGTKGAPSTDDGSDRSVGED